MININVLAETKKMMDINIYLFFYIILFVN